MEHGWQTRTDGTPKLKNGCVALKREITVDGKPYKVEVDDYKVGATFPVEVNDKTVEVALEKELDYKKPFTIKVQGKPYTVELTKVEKQKPFSVKVNDTVLKVELKQIVKKVAVTLASPTSVLIKQPAKKIVEEGVVTAPMAGKIISVRVKKGESVKTGDVLCTLEAMKMENEVTAPKNGVVEEVAIQEGQTVNADDVLIVIK